MSRRRDATVIGAFVVGAVALLALALAVFGGPQLFASRERMVTYFEGSVKGLREGSNVVFKGVPVGFVQNIALIADVETLEPKIEVTMELLPDSVKVLREGEPLEDAALPGVVPMEELVEAGFSAQLGSESFVTGQLLVELDFRPDQRLRLYGRETNYPEIPSVPSDIQQAVERFQAMVTDIERNVDFAAVGKRLVSALQGLDELANSPHLRGALEGADRLVNDPDAQQLASSLQDAIDELHATARRAGQLLEGLDDTEDGLVGELRTAAGTLTATLEDARNTLQAVRRQASGDTAQMYQLQSTMAEVEAAAEAMRGFFDYLERHPEALLRGKQP